VEFTLICPNDGRIGLGLEDISAVVFRDTESVEVVFICPQCGTSLRATLRVPNLLVAAMELARHAEEMGEVPGPSSSGRRASESASAAMVADDQAEIRRGREEAGECYCEYFRRQLVRVECVEDLLAETDEP